MIEQQVLARGLDNAPDAFDYIYECISGSHGNEIREYVDYHPDDDFEDIINRLLDDLGA